MRLLGICGSPRSGGNSEYLLDRFLAGAAESGIETEKIKISELKFIPCQECGGCDNTGFCVYNDDMSLLYQKLAEADVLVIAAPIFFTSLPAQLKAAIDRFQCFWIAKYELDEPRIPENSGKNIYFILTGGQKREDFFECSEKVVKAFAAVINYKYEKGFYFAGLDAIGDAARHAEYARTAYEAGRAVNS